MGQGTWGMADEEGDNYAAEMANRDWLRQREEDWIESQKQARNKKRQIKELVSKEVAAELKKHGIEKKPYATRGQKVICNCKNCGKEFEARVADRKRGWAKFCSKSCKAQHQDRSNPKNRKYYGT